MRQSHVAGERMFVDYAGTALEVIDAASGEVLRAQLFVAVLGACKYTYAEATDTGPDRLDRLARAHLRLLCPGEARGFEIRKAAPFPSLEKKAPRLLAEMHDDLRKQPLVREFILLSRKMVYNPGRPRSSSTTTRTTRIYLPS
jgi:hypothetical protein